MTALPLTPEPAAEAQRRAAALLPKALDAALRRARLLVRQQDEARGGATACERRDRVQARGAHALQAAVAKRPGSSAPAAKSP
jgi:hypothetical protein